MKCLLSILPFLTALSLASQAQQTLPNTCGESLLQTERDFARLSAQKGLEGWLSFFAEDATIFPVKKPVITGLPAIREYYTQVGFSPAGLTWEPTRAETSPDGQLGYSYGYWQLEETDSAGKKTTYNGKYATVWKKQADGRWKLVLDMGTN